MALQWETSTDHWFVLLHLVNDIMTRHAFVGSPYIASVVQISLWLSHHWEELIKKKKTKKQKKLLLKSLWLLAFSELSPQAVWGALQFLQDWKPLLVPVWCLPAKRTGLHLLIRIGYFIWDWTVAKEDQAHPIASTIAKQVHFPHTLITFLFYCLWWVVDERWGWILIKVGFKKCIPAGWRRTWGKDQAITGPHAMKGTLLLILQIIFHHTCKKKPSL